MMSHLLITSDKCTDHNAKKANICFQQDSQYVHYKYENAERYVHILLTYESRHTIAMASKYFNCNIADEEQIEPMFRRLYVAINRDIFMFINFIAGQQNNIS